MEASTVDQDQTAVEGDVQDIPLAEGLAEGIDQQQTRPRPGSGSAAENPDEDDQSSAKEQAAEDLAVLVSKKGSHEWTFGQGEQSSRSYIQRELSVIGKAQWFGLLGGILDEALSGENAISLNSLLAPPARSTPGQFQIQDFQDADTFVHALGKLLVFSPKFIHESVCIWLSVPDYEWELMKLLMEQSPEIGGMSDDDFEEILATFIDQNYPAIESFFRQRFQRLRARLQARAKEASQSRS
jgi:hypothetical protein